MKQPTVYLLSSGDELLFGHTVDTNSAWLAEQCTLLGWRIVGHRTVGDVASDIVDALREAAAKADVVVLTGGLGPTEDDRTRFALARAMGVGVEEDAEAVEEIRAMFRRYNRPMPDINKVQALMPEGASRIVNPLGTAPGIQARLGTARVFCLPGVPGEMKEMFRQTIMPILRGADGAESEVMRRLHLCGRGESEVGSAIRHLMGEKSNPEVGTAVAESVITIRMYAKGETMEEAKRVADRAEADIRAALEHDIFGVDGQTLAAAVGDILRERGATLAVAESCSGGMLSSLLVDIPGISDVFMEGVVTYSNQSKTNRLGVDPAIIERHGAVSRETASAMAEGLLMTGNFPKPAYSLAITGVAGPDGGTPEKPVGSVWIACSRLDENGLGLTRAMLLNTVTNRRGVRMRACNAALDLLRRTLKKYQSNVAVEERAWRIG